MATSTATAAYEFKEAMVAAAHTLWEVENPEVFISWGEWNGAFTADDQVWFTDVDSDQSTGPLSASNRSREETLTLTVEFVFFRPGEVDAAKEAEAAMYARLGELEYHVRRTDTTLGGVVRDCFLARHNTAAIAYSRGQDLGYLVAAAAEFEAHVRITQ